MKWKRIFLILVIMLIIPFVLSSFFHLEFKETGSIFSDEKEMTKEVIQLTESNIVDFMSDLPLQSNLSKVGWDHSTLSIDLNISGQIKDPNLVYRDLYTILQLGFEDTSNVKLILIRVFEYNQFDGSHKKLLMTIDASAGRWSEEMDQIENSYEELLSTFFKLKTTDYWEQWMNDIL
ncbi:hypothetical protein [Chengkuizengella marina]|uniref:DUF4825 domain-containing protein n=1 Tax=Chengkuizengella marina TaxID=2507566 RepID=A0A6N9Q6E2_9BACL|nr:hypothetical protein [Chengkuizengella marina]NBI30465.1 hypothetical protein [Chengkuizengella marina]